MRHMDTPTWSLGDRLRKARTEAGYTTSQFAKRLGLSRTTVSQWENGRAVPRRGFVIAWALLCAGGMPAEARELLTWLTEGEAAQ